MSSLEREVSAGFIVGAIFKVTAVLIPIIVMAVTFIKCILWGCRTAEDIGQLYNFPIVMIIVSTGIFLTFKIGQYGGLIQSINVTVDTVMHTMIFVVIPFSVGAIIKHGSRVALHAWGILLVFWVIRKAIFLIIHKTGKLKEFQ